jgi:hypothetical protein
MCRVLWGALAVATMAGAASAQTYVVAPNAFEFTAGGAGLNTLTRDLNAPRTYQMIIDSGQLTGIPVGFQITGVTWRANITPSNPATWPAANYEYANYNMWLGPAATTVSTMSTTFAANVGPGEVQVRSGPLTIPAGTFQTGTTGGISPWGYEIMFSTPYTYTGGSLVFTARHPGANVLGALFLDSVVGLANGVATMTGSTEAAVTGGASNSSIFRFTVIPAPSSLALLGLGSLLVTRRRR